MLARINVISKMILFVGFSPVFSNLLIFLEKRPASTFVRYRKQHSHVNIVNCMSPLWSLCFLILNDDAFITKNCSIWYCSYFTTIDNILVPWLISFFFYLQYFTLHRKRTKTIHMVCRQIKLWWCVVMLKNNIILW